MVGDDEGEDDEDESASRPVAQPDAAAEDDEGEDQDPHSRSVVATMSTTASVSSQLDLRVGRGGIWIESAMGRAER